ncbi:alpha/beta hydrolase [Novosphingobium sp. Gsoil 351]|uniref:alpha/beta hydrolase n=1 Tax=Novosphingobium sp. Gsoil 351 TaxID=2675225 RepID=UPI0012B4E1C9|nr:alpha/beta hydrolase [Novosphingobium sp. Gsoil 351]QGN53199.1 alpha/beta hydrolase fold domain-containing protein [Novosphingobium sp. Gsoil 351]QGN56201.1 alpha/beta hydrolase fold domain-containing protein [Novosphingobium sp. Gsoil 351]
MDTRHLVDPEVWPIVEALPFREFDRATLDQARAESAGRFVDLGAPPLAATIRGARRADGSEIELYCFDPNPGTQKRAALFHIHGGGMVLGTAKDMQFGPSAMAAALQIPVVSVEYRLAPETPFPGPQQDCLDGLAWMASAAEGLGIDPARIAIIGESAGGGLAAATALMARDTDGPKLAAQVLVYPMLDHRTGGAACRWNNRSTGEWVWTRHSNRFGWEALRGDYAAEDARKGWFSPALADNLAGLPPTLLLTGSLDLFFDEDLDYARRLVDAGVPVELHSYPGAIHAFNMVAEAAISQAFNRDLVSGIARLLKLEG